jgi:hypothetical protein
MIQTRKHQVWIDESGSSVPYSRVTQSERTREASLARLLKGAQDINKKLASYKNEIVQATKEIVDQFAAEKGLKTMGKGNVTLYNFDRSIKVEVSINDRIEFDDLTMIACKEKFDQFIDLNVQGRQEFIREIINDAFSTARGKLDSKKVMALFKYESKVSDPLFQEAMKLLRDSIRRPDSRTYYRIWLKDDSGEYQNIDLNFSSI